MECLKSINKHIIIDNRAYYLLFLQDMFPYFDKYLDNDYLPELVERIEYVMNLMDESNHISACDKALLLDYKAQLLFPRKEYDSALEVIDFCESTIEEVIGTNNLDYGLCEFYCGVIAYTRSQPVIAEQHLLNADAVFHAVMNEKPDNDYTKSTARYLYSLYMRWGKNELAEQYKKILISTH